MQAQDRAVPPATAQSSHPSHRSQIGEGLQITQIVVPADAALAPRMVGPGSRAPGTVIPEEKHCILAGRLYHNTTGEKA